MQFTMTLRQAIRAYWGAVMLLKQMRAEEDHDPAVVTSREEDVQRFEAMVELLQEDTIILVLTGEDDSLYDDSRVDLDALKMLLQRGIIFECLQCEEREDLAAESVYDGDHREFHLKGHHREYCITRALHKYNPARWPDRTPPPQGEHTFACGECGRAA
jgi:hypothetical protein